MSENIHSYNRGVSAKDSLPYNVSFQLNESNGMNFTLFSKNIVFASFNSSKTEQNNQNIKRKMQNHTSLPLLKTHSTNLITSEHCNNNNSHQTKLISAILGSSPEKERTQIKFPIPIRIGQQTPNQRTGIQSKFLIAIYVVQFVVKVKKIISRRRLNKFLDLDTLFDAIETDPDVNTSEFSHLSTTPALNPLIIPKISFDNKETKEYHSVVDVYEESEKGEDRQRRISITFSRSSPSDLWTSSTASSSKLSPQLSPTLTTPTKSRYSVSTETRLFNISLKKLQDNNRPTGENVMIQQFLRNFSNNLMGFELDSDIEEEFEVTEEDFYDIESDEITVVDEPLTRRNSFYNNTSFSHNNLQLSSFRTTPSKTGINEYESSDWRFGNSSDDQTDSQSSNRKLTVKFVFFSRKSHLDEQNIPSQPPSPTSSIFSEKTISQSLKLSQEKKNSLKKLATGIFSQLGLSSQKRLL
ncbi:hypothetical protein HK096_008199 [Nowakowskiella sp. JEL0078]|nr:hypothetical protein HK096_008199 [Nowakowskiella sp. JEL0078]